MPPYEKRDDVINASNRGNPAESGLCTLCLSDCKGKCETWLSSLRGRKMLYPRRFGDCTAGARNSTPSGTSYDSLRIQGFAHGAEGLPEGVSSDPDEALYSNVSIETEFGSRGTTKCKIPLMTGALGSTFIAQKYWESFAVGAAVCGFPLVIGENVVGVDKEAVLEDGKVVDAPELDRRLETYLEHADDEYGAIFVQLNVEDRNNGVAEYVAENYGDDVIIELKWGQGAKSIGGEIQVESLEYAKFLKERGYLVDPDPNKEEVQEAFKSGAIESFSRHSRLGGPDAPTVADVRQDFLDTVDYLRDIGIERVSLKTGAYSLKDTAMALKLASEADLELVTLDGAGGGTGMSPWNMMKQWGIPSLHLHSKVHEYAKLMDENGMNVPDISLAGGLAHEDHIFKALAISSPYVKLVCMGRGLMIPGFLGSNIQGALQPEKKDEVNGNWDSLPPTVNKYGENPEAIFAGWHDFKKEVGEENMDEIPWGAVALWNLVDKLGAGLKQLMAGSRKFSIDAIERSDLMSANKETEEITGIPYMTEAFNEEAKEVLLE